MNSRLQSKSALFVATALSAGFATSAWAQESTAAAVDDRDAIIVTARRMEERLQDVPISITVLNQETLDENNITTARDVASELSTRAPSD